MITLDARPLVLALAALLVGVLYGCPDDDSLTNCSSRNKPQHWDGQKWTCDDRR